MIKNNVIKEYKDQLPEKLQQIYKQIVDERIRIYYYGFLLGVLLSIAIIMYNLQLKPSNKMTNTSMICIIVSTSFLVNYFYYVLTPKSNYMLDHIESKEQTKAWLKMYSNMQYYYHMSLVLGIFTMGFFAAAFRC
jgi:prolipoprotein diacylglyceryltransferase